MISYRWVQRESDELLYNGLVTRYGPQSVARRKDNSLWHNWLVANCRLWIDHSDSTFNYILHELGIFKYLLTYKPSFLSSSKLLLQGNIYAVRDLQFVRNFRITCIKIQLFKCFSTVSYIYILWWAQTMNPKSPIILEFPKISFSPPSFIIMKFVKLNLRNSGKIKI